MMIPNKQKSKLTVNSHSKGDTDEIYRLSAMHRHRRFKLKPLDHIGNIDSQEKHLNNKKADVDPLENRPRFVEQLRGQMTPQKRQMLLHLRSKRCSNRNVSVQRQNFPLSILLHSAAKRIQRLVRTGLQHRKQQREELSRSLARRSNSTNRMPFLHLHRGAVNHRSKVRPRSARLRRKGNHANKIGTDAKLKSPTRSSRRMRKKGVTKCVFRRKQPALSSEAAAAKITRFFKRCVRIQNKIPIRHVAPKRRHSVSSACLPANKSVKHTQSQSYSRSQRSTSSNTNRGRRSRCRAVPARRTRRQRLHVLQCCAVTLISRTWRGFKSRRQYATFQKKREASVILSRQWRGLQCRRQYLRRLKRARAALVVISRQWRGVLARRVFARMQQRRRLLREKAALEISRYWRAARARSHVNSMRHMRRQHAAATTIERHWRGMLGRCKFRWRKHVQSRLREDCASKLIQVVYKLWRLRNRRSQHTRHTITSGKNTRGRKTKRGKGDNSPRGGSRSGRVGRDGAKSNINRARARARARARVNSRGTGGRDSAKSSVCDAGVGAKSMNRGKAGESGSVRGQATEHPYWNRRRHNWSSPSSGSHQMQKYTAPILTPALSPDFGEDSLEYGKAYGRRQCSRGGMFTTQTVATRQPDGDDDGFECFASFDAEFTGF